VGFPTRLNAYPIFGDFAPFHPTPWCCSPRKNADHAEGRSVSALGGKPAEKGEIGSPLKIGTKLIRGEAVMYRSAPVGFGKLAALVIEAKGAFGKRGVVNLRRTLKLAQP
jgi:hypothetical protein